MQVLVVDESAVDTADITVVIPDDDISSTEDLSAVDPLFGSPTLRREFEAALVRRQPFFDPFNNTLTTPDEIMECLRRFGIVYGRRRRGRR